jgi:hypothetical protein
MGTAILAGRDFTWSDENSKTPVAMVSESFARDYWGSAAAALHKQIREQDTNDDWREIVGVVGDIHYDGVDRPAPAACYFPLHLSNFFDEKEAVQRSRIVCHSDLAGRFGEPTQGGPPLDLVCQSESRPGGGSHTG